MASVSRVIAATPEQVFAVLAHGWSYSNWVTGTSHMRAVDANWPQPGFKLHHAAGIGRRSPVTKPSWSSSPTGVGWN